MNIYVQIMLITIAGGLISLIGGLFLVSNKTTATHLAKLAVPFAAGALLGAAFFELLPEAFMAGDDGVISKWILAGIISFFLLEYFIHWFHHDHDHTDAHHKSTAILVIIGDSIHNFIDGIAIGAAFLISPATGIITAIAVAAHEIPQEIGDFGLLLKYGYKRKQVIIINLLSALAATVGALVTYWIGTQATLPIAELLAITGGLFIYIAASDLIPAIHHDSRSQSAKISAAALLIGGLLVVGLTTSIAHAYLDDGHSHTEQDTHITEEPHQDVHAEISEDEYLDEHGKEHTEEHDKVHHTE